MSKTTTTKARPAKREATKPKATKREAAPLFDMRLPNGVRLGDATKADLEAAIPVYAEASSNRARLCREMIAIVARFDRGQF